jgi:alpha-tubulin suppressor-like RCC1 family protein
VAIAASAYHSLALRADGSVWAWGENEAGQLGDGSTVSRNRPVPVTMDDGSALNLGAAQQRARRTLR